MLYTGNGDGGDTTLFGSAQRFFKSDEQFCALGSLDTLNAYLGVIKTQVDGSWFDTIEELQQELFILQAQLAGATMSITDAHITQMEKKIQEIEATLPPITTFLLSGGTSVAAHLDYARTLARTFERDLIALHQKQKSTSNVRAYANRLSSYLFALSRKHNHEAHVDELPPRYGDKS